MDPRLNPKFYILALTGITTAHTNVAIFVLEFHKTAMFAHLSVVIIDTDLCITSDQ